MARQAPAAERLVIPATRVASIDVVRGAVMVLMAIDHVRVYSGLPAGGTDVGLFLTRWITHFCAPAFVFLAGTSAYLSAHLRGAGPGGGPGAPLALSRVLLRRGAWLVLLELTVIRACWTFNVDYGQYVLAGVIWMIGWCMILLAGLIRLPLGLVAGLGLAVVAGHNALDPSLGRIVPALTGSRGAVLWQVLYFGPIPLAEDSPLAVLYSIVPWIGVMACGYAFGRIVLADAPARHRACLAIGLGATALFVVLRGLNLYGDPRPWSGSLRSFLSTTKYPASLSFLLMTLGPTIAVLPFLERGTSRVSQVLATFGRVPFFFYLLHIPLIHLLAVAVSLARLGTVSPWLFTNHPMWPPPVPEGYTWSLSLLYLVWAVAVAALFPACRWFADVKRANPSPLLRYL